MDQREELQALRRMAELEAKASGVPTPAIPPAAEAPPSSPQKASNLDILAGLPATRILAGVASPVVGALQVGANVGDWIAGKMGSDPVLGKYLAEKIGEYEAAKKRGMVALGDNGADIAGFAGSAATGAAALRGVAPATTYAGRVGQGVAIGAGSGAITPSDTPGIDNTVSQAVAGGALGGGIPAVGPAAAKLGQSAYRALVEPLTNSAAIKGRAYMEAAGPKSAEIINALRASQPVVPGSFPTAGEAAISAGRPEFSALQASAEKILPTNYLARADARNTARVAQIDSVAGAPGALDVAKATRKATSAKLYGDAFAEGIDQPMAEALAPQIKLLLERPSMQDAKQIATELALEKNIRFSSLGQLEGLDWLKKGLDSQISSAAKNGSPISASKLQALRDTKTDLLATIEQLSPKYDLARATHAANSKPINQMEVGQYLKDKLVSPLDETANQKAASFAGAVRDAPGTLRRSLDNAPRYEKLTEVLTPAQFSKVEAIRQDLANMSKQEMLARKGTEAGPNAMEVASQSISGATGGGKIPNPLSRVVTIANAILGRLEGKIDRKLAIQIANEMLDPQQVAGILEKEVAKGAKKAATAGVVNKLRPTATAAGVNALVTSGQVGD